MPPCRVFLGRDLCRGGPILIRKGVLDAAIAHFVLPRHVCIFRTFLGLRSDITTCDSYPNSKY